MHAMGIIALDADVGSCEFEAIDVTGRILGMGESCAIRQVQPQALKVG